MTKSENKPIKGEIGQTKLAELSTKSASLFGKEGYLDDFIKSIEDAIGAFDPETADELLKYLKPIQLRSGTVAAQAREAVKTLDDSVLSTLSDTERTVLNAWLSNGPTTTQVLTKLGNTGGLNMDVETKIQAFLDEPSDQERSCAVLGALLALDVDGGVHLAVTFFRALIGGVPPRRLTRLLKILQIYCGLPAYSAGMQTLSVVNDVLEKLDQASSPPPPADVVNELRKRFGLAF